MKHPVVVCIAGGSGSGKTTCARLLADALGPDRCVAIPHDAYYRPVPARAELATWNFDAPDALETSLLVEHLDQLLRGAPVDLPEYDFSTHSRVGHQRLHPRPVLIVEGILTLTSSDLVARCAHRVFVHAEEHIRLARRIRRDTTERGRTLNDVLEQYFRTVRPSHERWVEPTRELASLLIDGAGDLNDSVRSLTSLLDD